MFWGSIVQLVASVVLLTGWIGVSVWAGVGSMVFFIAAQMMIVPFIYTTTGSEMEIVDKRLGLMREMLQGQFVSPSKSHSGCLTLRLHSYVYRDQDRQDSHSQVVHGIRHQFRPRKTAPFRQVRKLLCHWSIFSLTGFGCPPTRVLLCRLRLAQRRS